MINHRLRLIIETRLSDQFTVRILWYYFLSGLIQFMSGGNETLMDAYKKVIIIQHSKAFENTVKLVSLWHKSSIIMRDPGQLLKESLNSFPSLLV